MSLKINEPSCIGCGACMAIAPDVFDFNDEGFASIITTEESVLENNKDNITEAVEGCPTSAIVEE